ncbi:hypothetical protein MJO28_002152 [Puccinia striiformis f. sp. tritici]|uniref:Uncharacterized protein n=1 Tax=Puccinia striiformis f. sp. tritici TaxID=168172 RepID=A0ACC0EVJ6_9BASI|nr:hypothetical protein MJO28_002152 [Puccinia striiformis f. sp. tritici]
MISIFCEYCRTHGLAAPWADPARTITELPEVDLHKASIIIFVMAGWRSMLNSGPQIDESSTSERGDVNWNHPEEAH